MKNFIAKMGAALIVLMAASASYAGTMKDSRDGKTYKTVKIGKQVWMAENLNYQTGESKCYENKPENCEKYGRLYVWREAVTACPDGWHLPNNQEFEDLKTLAGQKAGDIKKAGTVLKSSTGWNWNEYDGKSGNGSDGLGFGALPAGGYARSIDYFLGGGNDAGFWSSTEFTSDGAYGLKLYYSGEGADVGGYVKLLAFFSVRCVKNP
ncbi:MAG: fibrobacter succinogenes major paralogous domain-containing protein [Fibrobacter sp.]|nr:fibrobacter succinogenes major paralogous domain-containing protein [Fibrobacter sp.]